MVDSPSAEATSVPLSRTPLYALHLEQNARMVPFSGWEMPVQYGGVNGGIGKEHQAVRQAAGMFDISHMGKFSLRGRLLLEHLQPLVPSDLSRLQPGEAQYTVLLNPEAGIVDDLILYYEGETAAGEQQITTIVNASTLEKDKSWLLAHLDSASIEFIDLSASKALIAVQGATAVQALQAFVTEDLFAVKRFGHLTGTVLGHPGFLARTGYTGEDGYEVMLEPEVAAQLWRSLLAAGVIPCGLGARDTLRLEAAMALYGQDINETTTPLEAGLGWLVHLDPQRGLYRAIETGAAKTGGVERRLVGLQMTGRNIARHDYPVICGSEATGIVTSGTLSPTLGYPIALAYVPSQFAKLDQLLEVEIRGKTHPAKVVKRPFYKSPSL